MSQQPQERRINGHPVFAAVYDFQSRWREEKFMAEHRQYLSEDLHGAVLDIGSGTGDMFPYFKKAAERDPSLQFHGIEPDPYMRKRAEKRATETGISIDIRSDIAEALPYEDERFDIVIACSVLCTVSDVERTLKEVHRVLKSDGELRFCEHVRSDGLGGYLRDALTPIWKQVNAGCHLNRQPEKAIRKNPLEMIEIDHIDSVFQPLKRGRAIRRNER
jgi:ubiquinone/menaquinone biosynthesis C-methylase UbiE